MINNIIMIHRTNTSTWNITSSPDPFHSCSSHPTHQTDNHLTNKRKQTMPLHLLHHKSYHVYSASNISRVQRDEAAARAAANAEDERAHSSAATQRIETLRSRVDGNPPPSTSAPPSSSHSSFLLPPPRADHKKPPPQPPIKDETLGSIAGATPWYSTLAPPPQPPRHHSRKDDRHKSLADPLRAVRKGVRDFKAVHHERQEWKRQRERETSSSSVVTGERKKQRRHHHHHHHSHHQRDGGRVEKVGDDSNAKDIGGGGGDAMDALRAEKARREKAEREKAEAMLLAERLKKATDNMKGWAPVEGGRYSKQFGVGGVRRQHHPI